MCLMENIANKGTSSQSYGLSSSHIWMWELDYKESWAPKNWCLWTVVLEKTLESPFQPVKSSGRKQLDMTERLNWTELMCLFFLCSWKMIFSAKISGFMTSFFLKRLQGWFLTFSVLKCANHLTAIYLQEIFYFSVLQFQYNGFTS